MILLGLAVNFEIAQDERQIDSQQREIELLKSEIQNLKSKWAANRMASTAQVALSGSACWSDEGEIQILGRGHVGL